MSDELSVMSYSLSVKNSQSLIVALGAFEPFERFYCKIYTQKFNPSGVLKTILKTPHN